MQEGAVAWGDYDNDGYLDLLLTGNIGRYTSKTGATRLYHNNGDGSFSEVTSGLPAVWGSSAAWGDYDNDGYLDIVLSGVTNSSSGFMTRVYRSNGNGTFTDVQAGFAGIAHGSS
jgi:hypothetical protein